MRFHKLPRFFIKNPPQKQVYMEKKYTFFHDTFKTKIKKDFFKKNPSITKFGMSKNMTHISQARIKPSFP